MSIKGATLKRINTEINAINTKNEENNITAGPKNENNIFQWSATILGPEGSPYEDGTFILDIDIPNNYPFKPPKINFRTKIYHPNINDHGSICLDILADKWSTALTIEATLLSISSLLTDPNPDDPLVATIAKEYVNDRKIFNENARKWTNEHA